jgi:hypothetical protein
LGFLSVLFEGVVTKPDRHGRAVRDGVRLGDVPLAVRPVVERDKMPGYHSGDQDRHGLHRRQPMATVSAEITRPINTKATANAAASAAVAE